MNVFGVCIGFLDSIGEHIIFGAGGRFNGFLDLSTFSLLAKMHALEQSGLRQTNFSIILLLGSGILLNAFPVAVVMALVAMVEVTGLC